MLDFRNWTFASPDLRMRAIMAPSSKFHLNLGLIGQYGAEL